LSRWKIGFYLYMLATSITFGIYLVVSRDIAYNEYVDQYGFVVWLIAAENIPSVFSVLAGGLGDVLGRRRLLIIGSLSFIPLLLMGYLPSRLLPFLAGGYIALWTLSSPSVTGALLDATSSSGFQYSLYTMFGSIGWGVGGLLGGYLKAFGGRPLSFTAASVIILGGFTAAYLTYPRHAYGGLAKMEDVSRGIRKLSLTFVGLTSLFMSIMIFYGSFAIKLRDIAGSPQMFGLLYTTLPALTGTLVRPIAGIISDK